MNDKDSRGEDVIWEGLKIYKTFDYDKFKTLKGNRKVKTSQVIRLKASFQKGQIPVPIIVNELFEVVDGQTRLRALRELELPIPYTIIEGLRIKEVQTLNAQRKNWTTGDHLKCWIERGKSMYIAYNEKIHQKFHFDHITKIMLVKSETIAKGQNSQEQVEMFKDGDFKATEEEFEHAIEIGLKIEDVERFFSEHLIYGQRRCLWNAVRKLADYPSYVHTEMLKKLEIQKPRIEKLLIRFTRLTTNEFLIILEDIYNYKNRKEPIVFRHALRSEERIAKVPKEISV